MNGENAALNTFETTKDDGELALIAKRREPVDRLDAIIVVARTLRSLYRRVIYFFLRADQNFF